MWAFERLDHLDGLVLTPLHGDSPQSYPQTGRVLAGETVYLAVALDVPLPGLFDYSHDRPVAPGVRVRVTFGRRAMVGMVWAVREAPGVSADRVRPIDAVLDDLPPMPADWLRLAEFAAHYYHRPLGEVLLPVLPPSLRKPAAYTGARSAGGPVCRADRRPGGARARKRKDAAQPGRSIRRRARPVPRGWCPIRRGTMKARF